MGLLHKISWKTVIIGTIIFIVFLIFVLPAVSSFTETNIGVSSSPDMSFFYGSSDLYEMAFQYGDSGRQLYITIRWTFDLLWPLVYTFFLLPLTIKLSLAVSKRKWISKLYLIPLLAMIFDYLENIGVTILMSRYPLLTPSIDSIIPIVSMIKWFLIIGGYIIATILLLVFLYKKVRKKI